MPIEKRWVIRCDDGCDKSFQVNDDVSLAGVMKFMPRGWLMVRWTTSTEQMRQTGRDEQVRYFSSPSCIARWVGGSKDAAEVTRMGEGEDTTQ